MRPYMDREAAIDDFLEKYVFGRWEEDIPLIGQAYEKNQAEIEAGLLNAVDGVCRKAVLLQEQQLKGDIQYLYFTFLMLPRLNLLPCCCRRPLRPNFLHHPSVIEFDVCRFQVDVPYIGRWF